jgi:hypothetical protein
MATAVFDDDSRSSVERIRSYERGRIRRFTGDSRSVGSRLPETQCKQIAAEAHL